MKTNTWNIIAKDLAGETNASEKAYIEKLRASDSQFDLAYSDSEKIWNNISAPQIDFNKERIVQLRDSKIKRAKLGRKNRFISESLKYAAIFIGVAIAAFFTYNDLTRQTIITAETSKNILLPDGSQITMLDNAVISYNNSLILGFRRNVSITEGSAYFEIAKSKGDDFIVNTLDYSITVLGTKFIVSEEDNTTSVTLDEGKIELSDYCISGIDNITMKPGERIIFGDKMDSPTKELINANVSKFWMQERLEFDKYSLQDLKEIFKEYYGKELLVNEGDIQINAVGGSAPVDDVELIVKALSKVFNKEFIILDDSIILK